MQIQRTVRLVAVQVDGHADHGDVREEQGKQDDLPPIQAPSAMSQPFQSSVAHSPKGFRHVLSFFQRLMSGRDRFSRRATL
jgi:hypothetical protein